jgi:hypothetical protein
MRAYLLPITFAAAGAAMLIHSKSDQQKDMAAKLPAVPLSSFVSQTQSSRDTQRPLRPVRVADSSRLTPTAFKRAATDDKTNTLFDKPYEFFHYKLTKLNYDIAKLQECLRVNAPARCQFDNNDPKEYEIQLYADATTTLQNLKKWLERHELRDDRITDLMTDFITFDNAYLKMAALDILATQRTDKTVLDPLLEDVIEYPQPEPIAAGMKELRRYHTFQEKIKIDNTLERVLRTGAVNAAEEVAKNLKPLINAHNWNRYDKIRDDMARSPLSEDIYVALSEALDN